MGKVSSQTKKVTFQNPLPRDKDLEDSLKASIKKTDKDEKVRFLRSLQRGESKSILASSGSLDDVFAMHRQGKSSVDIAKFLLEKDSYIRDLYADKPESKRILNLSAVVRKFIQKSRGSFDKLPNYHLESYLHRKTGKLRELEMMEALICYMLERIDKWIKFEKNSPVPMRDARMEVQLAFESLERYVLLKSTLGLEIETSESVTYQKEKDDKSYLLLKKKLAEIVDPIKRKEASDKFHGVPMLKRDVA